MIKVYDRLNPERFLGTLSRPPIIPCKHPSFEVAVYRPLDASSVVDTSATYSPDINTIRFYKHILQSDDGWSAEVVVSTDAPLDLLMDYEFFFLPEESDRQYHTRRYYR